MAFFYQLCRESGGMRVRLSGEIDIAVSDELRSLLADSMTAFPGLTDLDLHDLTFLDCAGIGEFIRAYNSAHGRGHTLTISRSRGIVHRVLELTGVLSILALDNATVRPANGHATVPPLHDRAYSA